MAPYVPFLEQGSMSTSPTLCTHVQYVTDPGTGIDITTDIKISFGSGFDLGSSPAFGMIFGHCTGLDLGMSILSMSMYSRYVMRMPTKHGCLLTSRHSSFFNK